jgi:predicted signal transduction protein with EAL and GGDEF domain
VSLNVSGRDLLDTGLADVVEQCLTRHHLPASTILLEIDERVLTTEPAHSVATAEALANIGVGLSLDDFGTGYSSLLRLKRLPFSEIKVDSSFIGRLLESPDDEVVVKSILDLAAALGIRSIAEGVESAEVASTLLAMGCVAAQGYHFARPMNAASATAWLSQHSGAIEPVASARVNGARVNGTPVNGTPVNGTRVNGDRPQRRAAAAAPGPAGAGRIIGSREPLPAEPHGSVILPPSGWRS